MIKPIKTRLNQLFKRTSVRKYEITHQGLLIFTNLKPRSQKLFVQLLNEIKFDCNINAIIIEKTHKELGFDSFSNYSKYKQELVDNKLIIYERNSIFINPMYVNYFKKRQLDYFYAMFEIRKDIKVRMEIPMRKVI